MSQTTFIEGKNLIVTVDGVPIGCDKSTNLEVTTAMYDTTTKCSQTNGVLFQEQVPEVISTKMTGNGLVAIVTSAGLPHEVSAKYLLDAQYTQLKVYATWADAGNNIFYGADAYFTSLKVGANFNEVATYDYTLETTGAVLTIPVS